MHIVPAKRNRQKFNYLIYDQMQISDKPLSEFSLDFAGDGKLHYVERPDRHKLYWWPLKVPIIDLTKKFESQFGANMTQFQDIKRLKPGNMHDVTFRYSMACLWLNGYFEKYAHGYWQRWLNGKGGVKRGRMTGVCYKLVKSKRISTIAQQMNPTGFVLDDIMQAICLLGGRPLIQEVIAMMDYIDKYDGPKFMDRLQLLEMAGQVKLPLIISKARLGKILWSKCPK